MSGRPYDRLVAGTLVLPDRIVPDGWIAIRGDTIAAVGEGPRPAASAVHDAGSAFLLPGVIDGQTHATSAKGLPGIESSTRGAIAGGITTLVDMPYDNPEPLNTLAKLTDKA